MRIIHTSDWHLGHTLHELPRKKEHAAFLAWLLDRVGDEKADALLIAGDVFETANPPADAQADFYRFLAAARARYPSLGVVVIGGNHDSAGRLDAPQPLLDALGVHVVGGLPRAAGGAIDFDRCLVRLNGALVLAVPFLRPADLPPIDPQLGDPLVEGVRKVYAEVVEEARRRRKPGEALVAMGHCYMTSTELSELSERKILGGNQHALPVDLFADDLAYVALGHLHLAQQVGAGERIRYSGSPLPLSFGEAGYRHEVVVVDLEGEKLVATRSLPIPRSVELLRLPKEGPKPLAQVLADLKALPARKDEPLDALPFLEVRVRLEQPEPALRRELEQALEGKAARLTKITSELTGTKAALAEAAKGAALADLKPEDVFKLKYQRDFQKEPSAELLEAFGELLEQHSREEAA